MPDDNIVDLNEYRSRKKGDDQWVTCPRCGARIYAHTMRCPDCGVHFRGLAYEFSPEENAERRQPRAIRWLAVVLLVLAGVCVLAVIFALLMGR